MWKVKVALQFILSRIPWGEELNYGFQKLLKSHSLPKTEARVVDLAREISRIYPFLNLRKVSVVEIGTGWDAINPLLLYVLGANSVTTFDHVPHVRWELAKLVVEAIKNKVQDIAAATATEKAFLQERIARIDQVDSLKELFAQANITYRAPGDAANTGLPKQSVDLVYSYAVLEHIPPQAVIALTHEAKRILKRTGFAYHLIGLHDHYSCFDKSISRVHFLKYPEKLWSFWVYNAIAYHNRLREKSFFEMFQKCGARIDFFAHQMDERDVREVKMMKIDRKFSRFTPEELAVHQTQVILSFPDDSPGQPRPERTQG